MLLSVFSPPGWGGPSRSTPGYRSLMGKFITFDGGIAQLRYLIIREWESGTPSQTMLLPCGEHSVSVQCQLRPTPQWWGRVRALHSGECTAPLAVQLAVA